MNVEYTEEQELLRRTARDFLARRSQHGMSPREATLKAMQEVSGPVVAIALILTAVFVPGAIMGGIRGQLYQQFAITIAISVLLSAFNALTLSPALSSLMLKPPTGKGLLQPFYRGFNRVFGWVTNGYIAITRRLIARLVPSLLFIGALIVVIVLLLQAIPQGFVPEEDQGYMMVNVQLPDAASLPRTDEVCRKVEAILGATPGIHGYVTVVGYSMISQAAATNTGLRERSSSPIRAARGRSSPSWPREEKRHRRCSLTRSLSR